MKDTHSRQSASLAEAKALIEHHLPELTSAEEWRRKDALERIRDLVELTRALERRGAPLPANAKGTCEECDFWGRLTTKDGPCPMASATAPPRRPGNSPGRSPA